MKRSFHVVLAGLLLVGAAACNKPNGGPDASKNEPSATANANVAPTGDVVATVNGQKITREELEKEIHPRLVQMERQYRQGEYNLKKQALDQMIVKRLLDAERAKTGASEEQLFKTEVADKATPPTEAEARAFFEQNKAAIQQRNPGVTYDKVKQNIGQFLSQQKMQQAEAAYIERLKGGAKIDVTLPPPEMPKVDVAATGPSKGPENAPVTIVEFSDFQCPYCSKVKPVLDQVMSTYGGKVRLVFRDYPLPIHPLAPKAAEAGHCAEEQGKFWEMHDAMFAHQDKLEVAGLKELARQVPGLDGAKFDQCLDGGKFAKAVQDNVAAGNQAAVDGTPAFFINGQLLSGAATFDDFKAVIDQELNRKRS